MSQYLVHHSQLTQPSLSTLSIPHIHRSQDTHRNQGLRPNLVTLPNLATLLNRIILHSQVTLLNQVTQCNRATLPNLVTLHSQDQMVRKTLLFSIIIRINLNSLLADLPPQYSDISNKPPPFNPNYWSKRKVEEPNLRCCYWISSSSSPHSLVFWVSWLYVFIDISSPLLLTCRLI